MSGKLDTPIISIDRGASFTDFAIVESGRLTEKFSLEDRSWQAIESAYTRLKTQYQTEHVVFSGCATGMPAAMQEYIYIISEAAARISLGSARLLKALTSGRYWTWSENCTKPDFITPTIRDLPPYTAQP